MNEAPQKFVVMDYETMKKRIESPEFKERLEYEECGYRRGYMQAYSQAIDDMRQAFAKGHTIGSVDSLMADFFDMEIMHWRYAYPLQVMEHPPEMSVEPYKRKK